MRLPTVVRTCGCTSGRSRTKCWPIPGHNSERYSEFRSRIETERAFLFRTYDDPGSWEREFRQHLARSLDNLPPFVAPPAGVDIPPEFEERLRHLERERRGATDTEGSAQSRITKAASDLGRQAIEAARAGRFTEAETFFASSLDLEHDPDVAYAYGRFREQLEKSPKKPLGRRDALGALGIDLLADDRSQAAADLLTSLISKGDIRELIDTLTTKVVLILGDSLENATSFWML